MKAEKAYFARYFRQLEQISRRYDNGSRVTKLRLLRKLSSFESFPPKSLRKYHDTLLFLEAFPDSLEIYQGAKVELSRLAALVPALLPNDQQLDRELLGSGISGSRVLICPGLVAMKWLLSHCCDDINLELEEGPSEEGFDDFLRDLSGLPLSDAILHHEVSTKDLLRSVSGLKRVSARWLRSIVSLSRTNSVLAEHFYKALNFWLYWRLSKRFSRTCLRLRSRAPFVHEDGLLKSFDVQELVRRRLPEPTKIGQRKKRIILDVARAILYQQGRETDYVNYGTADDLFLFELDRGVDIVFLGTEPSRRRYFESFYGFVAFKNGIPCAYGGAWICGGKADIGINIFEQFRGGESLHLFAEVMRCYHQHFGVDVFEVEPYQFGKGNEEGVESGAFWFYWKVGYRSMSGELNRLAAEELKKPSARTSARNLKRLCADKLRFSLGHGNTVVSVQQLGMRVCTEIGESYGGDIELASNTVANDLATQLQLNLSLWTAAERESLVRLSLPLSMLIAPAKLTAEEKHQVAKLIKDKVAPSEWSYCRSLKRCASLFRQGTRKRK